MGKGARSTGNDREVSRTMGREQGGLTLQRGRRNLGQTNRLGKLGANHLKATNNKKNIS